MGFSIDGGIGSYGWLLVFFLAVPAIILIVWWVQLNRQVRHDLHDQDEHDDTPIG